MEYVIQRLLSSPSGIAGPRRIYIDFNLDPSGGELRIGDRVIIKKEQTAPFNWTLGRINELFFEPDQKVRVVSVNTKYGDK
ncbi:hypothetical protein TNIN_487231 [Trichonephila inaurata madagascariensis]|uniref:DUF5641 domain-containing protein n=1 Tax=Trichonephila inaurata madagascariensis TaxID=2747483 RepID=A0A8X6IKI1_9ARAC|nr:hypothetical protein TNIN_487231 [Trichonephila inaurata madagascariensis]